jgi:hypothetical protein
MWLFFLIGLFFDPEDGGDTLPTNVSWLPTDHTALYHRRILHNHRSQNLDTHDFIQQLLHLTKSAVRRFGRTVNISDSYLIGTGLDSRLVGQLSWQVYIESSQSLTSSCSDNCYVTITPTYLQFPDSQHCRIIRRRVTCAYIMRKKQKLDWVSWERTA